GIAQLVERNLAKVEGASSRLVSRSRIQKGQTYVWAFFVVAWPQPVARSVTPSTAHRAARPPPMRAKGRKVFPPHPRLPPPWRPPPPAPKPRLHPHPRAGDTRRCRHLPENVEAA